MTDTQYLNELGIANFEFLPKENSQNTAEESVVKKIKVKCLVLEKKSTNSFCTSGACQNLLNKMLTIIGLEAKDTAYKITSNSEKTINKYDAEIIILAGDFQDEHYFVIPHPSEILQNPDLKRDAWEVLKKIKENL